jgi:osmotically-inducible protein OsmY
MKLLLQIVLPCLLTFTGVVSAQTSKPQTAPDNTKVNERDRQKNRPTADQQKENRSDLDITRNIRKAVVDDKGLSTYAHNVKIITQNGNVTLRGPVRSAEEKATIESKATAVAGAGHVKSELTIAADKAAPTKKTTEKPSKRPPQ